MRSTMFWLIAPLALAASVGARPALAADNAADEAAIKKNAEAFITAFDKGDAKAVAAFWTADGDYVDETGRHMKGRDEIEKAFTEFFAENKGLKVEIHTESLRFVTPDVAVEDGVTSVAEPDGGPPSRARYTVVHVKKGGQWQLSSVRDTPYAPPSNYEHLKELEWAVGDWADEGENGPAARVSFEWSESQNFILGTFTATFKNIEVTGGRKRSAGTRPPSASAPGASTTTAASAKRPGARTATAGSSSRSRSSRTARRSPRRTSSRASTRTPSAGSRRIGPWTASRPRTSRKSR